MARPNPPIIHLVVAMAVVLAPALLVIAFFTRTPEPAVNRVDPAPVVAQARAESPFPIAVPENLPEGWVCTRARWTPVGQPGPDGTPVAGNTFALGYLSPQQMYVGLDQQDGPAAAFLAQVTRDGRPDGTSAVGETTWTRYRSPDDRTRALALTADGHVTVVSADLGYEALEAFAATLRFGN